MNDYHSRLSQRSSKLRDGALLLAGLLAGGLAGPVFAQDAAVRNDSADSALVTVGTGMLPALVTAGAIDPNGKVPVLDGVAGSGVANADISIPLTVLTHGTSYCFSVALQDVNVTGDYEVDYYIKQEKSGVTKTIAEQMIVTGKTTAPGDTWVWFIYSKDIPDSPGIATLVGRVRWGTGYTTEATVSSKILIQ
jgi:hypothetical protein